MSFTFLRAVGSDDLHGVETSAGVFMCKALNGVTQFPLKILHHRLARVQYRHTLKQTHFCLHAVIQWASTGAAGVWFLHSHFTHGAGRKRKIVTLTFAVCFWTAAVRHGSLYQHSSRSTTHTGLRTQTHITHAMILWTAVIGGVHIHSQYLSSLTHWYGLNAGLTHTHVAVAAGVCSSDLHQELILSADRRRDALTGQWITFTSVFRTAGQSAIADHQLVSILTAGNFTLTDGQVTFTDLLGTADSFLQDIHGVFSLSLTQRSRFITALGLYRNHTTVFQTPEETAAAQRAVPHLTWSPWCTVVIRTHALVLGDTESRICSVKDGAAFTNTLLSDRRAGAFFIVIAVLACSRLACVHTGFVFFTRRTFEWAEVAFPPAEADLMSVANGNISSQEVTLVLFIMQVTGPYLIAEVFWRNLVVASGERPLVEHGETFGAVSGGAVVSHSAEVICILCGVHHPPVQKHWDVLNIPDHCTIGQPQVIGWITITTSAEPPGGGVIRSSVLQHHDASAVVPLYVDATGCVYDVHGPGVVNMEVLPAERKPSCDLIHGHLSVQAVDHDSV